MSIPHDLLFKELIRVLFQPFLEMGLPQVSPYVERDDFEFIQQELIDSALAEHHLVDLLVKVRFHGEPAYFLIHIEHQSTAQADFPNRMFRYCMMLMLKYDLPVYPVVIYSFDTPRSEQPDHYEVKFPDKTVLSFHFTNIQLNRMNWRDYLNKPNPAAAALMAKMNIADEDRPKVKLECLRMLMTLKLDPAKMRLISSFVDAYLKLNKEEEQVFRKELQAVVPKEQETVMELVTSWMEEGIEKGLKQGLEKGRIEGRQEGEAKGRQEGEATVVLRQLRRRFGTLTPEFEQRVRALQSAQLEELAEAILDFKTLAEVEAWLASRP